MQCGRITCVCVAPSDMSPQDRVLCISFRALHALGLIRFIIFAFYLCFSFIILLAWSPFLSFFVSSFISLLRLFLSTLRAFSFLPPVAPLFNLHRSPVLLLSILAERDVRKDSYSSAIKYPSNESVGSYLCCSQSGKETKNIPNPLHSLSDRSRPDEHWSRLVFRLCASLIPDADRWYHPELLNHWGINSSGRLIEDSLLGCCVHPSNLTMIRQILAFAINGRTEWD
jgi:hypothetical protein